MKTLEDIKWDRHQADPQWGAAFMRGRLGYRRQVRSEPLDAEQQQLNEARLAELEMSQ